MIGNRNQKSPPTPGLPATPTKSQGHVSTRPIAGLPTGQDNDHPYYNDIHMNTVNGAGGLPDVRMATAKGYTVHDDVRMETARYPTTLKQSGLPVWARELVESSEVKRKATVAQLCEYNSAEYKLFQYLVGLRRRRM